MKNTILWILMILSFSIFIIIFVPLISFTCYDKAVKDAARIFNIKEYNMIFYKDKMFTRGGFYNNRGGEHNIHVREIPVFRALNVATIFHEFAHAYQVQNNLPRDRLEKDAERLSFEAMWNNGYRWEAINIFVQHLIFAKSADYRNLPEIWEVIIKN